MKKYLSLIIGLCLLLGLNYDIWNKEKILKQGQTVYLELAPVDPRSLMQGDYMRLAFAIERSINKETVKEQAKTGRIVIIPNDQGIGQFESFYNGQSLNPNQKTVNYSKTRRWNNSISIQPNSFFFQEGHRPLYEQAKYGVFKYQGPHTYLLHALADKDLNIIEPQ